jgi:hypothetical protein
MNSKTKNQNQNQMVKLNISTKYKSKDEYIKECEDYYIQSFGNSDKKAMDFLIYNLENATVKDDIKKYYNNRYNGSDNTERISNKDNVEYSESYVRDILFYVMNTDGEEQKMYYERLLFMETWKWDFLYMLKDKKEIDDFGLSVVYRQWKIKKVLD